MNLFVDLISKYFWVVAIMVIVTQALFIKQRAKKYIQQNLRLLEVHERIFKGYLFWMNVPWVIMGIGCTIGRVPTIWHYFRPKDGNPWVLVWFGSVFFIWIQGTIWLFFRGGAEMLAEYSAVFTGERKNPTKIKIIWVLCILGGILGARMMWIIDIPIPALLR